MLRLMDAWRIEEYDLTFFIGMDTENPVPRRLSLIRYDRDLLLYDVVDERRLAYVGAADNGYKAGFEWFLHSDSFYEFPSS